VVPNKKGEQLLTVSRFINAFLSFGLIVASFSDEVEDVGYTSIKPTVPFVCVQERN